MRVTATGDIEIDVHVVPGAKRDRLGPLHGERIKAHVSAPPVDGKANDAVCALCAQVASLPNRAATVLRGQTSRHKTIRLVVGDAMRAHQLIKLLDQAVEST